VTLIFSLDLDSVLWYCQQRGRQVVVMVTRCNVMMEAVSGLNGAVIDTWTVTTDLMSVTAVTLIYYYSSYLISTEFILHARQTCWKGFMFLSELSDNACTVKRPSLQPWQTVSLRSSVTATQLRWNEVSWDELRWDEIKRYECSFTFLSSTSYLSHSNTSTTKNRI